MTDQAALRNRIAKSIGNSEAHITFEKAIEDLPPDLRGKIPAGLPYSIWQLVEHLRIAQWDILEFSRKPDHESPSWPNGYWPEETTPADEQTWEQSLQQIASDREAFTALLHDEQLDLLTPFPWGSGQTLLREALLIIAHNSYHTGEIIVMRRLLGAWK